MLRSMFFSFIRGVFRDEVAEHDSEQVVLHGPGAVGFVIIFGGNLCVFLDFNAMQYIKLPSKKING